jgi:hypothetical protein
MNEDTVAIASIVVIAKPWRALDISIQWNSMEAMENEGIPSIFQNIKIKSSPRACKPTFVRVCSGQKPGRIGQKVKYYFQTGRIYQEDKDFLMRKIKCGFFLFLTLLFIAFT